MGLWSKDIEMDKMVIIIITPLQLPQIEVKTDLEVINKMDVVLSFEKNFYISKFLLKLNYSRFI
jgi:hypothetical protein